MIVRDFRASFQKLTEPVQVLRSRSSKDGDVEFLGSWYPEKTVTTRTGVRYPAEQVDNEHPERSGKA